MKEAVRTPDSPAEMKSAIFKGLVKVIKVCTSKYLFSVDTAEVDDRGLGGVGDGTAIQTETKDETTEHLPDLPLSTAVVTEDSMADHQVTEDGNTDRNEPVPRDKEHVEEDKPGAGLGRSELVPRRLDKRSDCHCEDVGEAIQNHGSVEAGALLAPDDDGGPDVDDGGEGQQGQGGPGVGRGEGLVHHCSPIGKESEVNKVEKHCGWWGS